MAMTDLMSRIATTDRTFRRSGGDWVGKCLICNGPIAFDSKTGEGGTVEHIRAKTQGGTEALSNLAVVHGRCNWEKGRRWDSMRRRNQADYDELVDRMLIRRFDRWCEPPQ